MLYWDEGAKRRNSLVFANSDPDMVIFFVRFLREGLKVRESYITVSLNFYLGNGPTTKDIQNYWLETLELPESCLRKTIINVQPKSSQQKGRKLQYGVCRIQIISTRILQQIFGAIQEYTGIEKPEWLL